MNLEIEPVHVGEEEDIDVGSVENFEHEEIDYAIFRLESGFFATQGNCTCTDRTLLSEADVDGEELNVAMEEWSGWDTSSEEFDWWDLTKAKNGEEYSPQEVIDEMVYGFFEDGKVEVRHD